MSIPRFYLDEDSCPRAVLRALRGHGVDVQKTTEAGLGGANDDRHIAHVLASGRVLITGDHRLRDAMAEITRRGNHHPGLLFVRVKHRADFGAIIFSIRLVHASYTAEEMVDRVEYIPF